MPTNKTFMSTMPRKALLIFLVGVFFLFSTIALASDMTQMGRQPLPRFAVSILLTSVFALGYAAAGFLLRARAWIAMVPIFLVQFVSFALLNKWMPSLPQVAELNSADLARVQNRLNIDAIAIIVVMCLGYACFVYASITEGRRYFRAHAEIALAKEIHQVLVPTIDITMGGFEFYGKSSPSGEVGGDLIDLAGTGEKWVAYLADVSGHGVAPGLVMGMAKSASRMLLSSGDDSGHLMPRLNEVLYPLKTADMFITFCFVACFSTASGGHLRVGLAGHPSILRFSAQTGEVTELECPNMPLGILPSGEFATAEITAQSGELFALYTDGFLEATNKAGEEFGVKRLQAELQKYGKEPLATICESIKASVAQHGAQFDDQSMLLIRRL